MLARTCPVQIQLTPGTCFGRLCSPCFPLHIRRLLSPPLDKSRSLTRQADGPATHGHAVSLLSCSVPFTSYHVVYTQVAAPAISGHTPRASGSTWAPPNRVARLGPRTSVSSGQDYSRTRSLGRYKNSVNDKEEKNTTLVLFRGLLRDTMVTGQAIKRSPRDQEMLVAQSRHISGSAGWCSEWRLTASRDLAHLWVPTTQ